MAFTPGVEQACGCRRDSASAHRPRPRLRANRRRSPCACRRSWARCPSPSSRAAKRARRAGSAMMTLPIWAPAMLKVLVVAVIITSRSAISGAAIGHRRCACWPGIDQVVVNLVRDQDQVVALAEIGDAAQFVRRPDPAAGIVRRAEDQHLLARRSSARPRRRNPSRSRPSTGPAGIPPPRARRL